MRCSVVPLVGLLLACLALPAGADPLLLISEAEAAQPDAPAGRGPRFQEDGPLILMETPEHDASYTAPMTLRTRFEVGEQGHPVDMSTLKVSYVKLIKIDVTDRLAEFFTEDGILVPEAAVPSGKHTFEIYIEDVEKNASFRRTTFRVEKGG